MRNGAVRVEKPSHAPASGATVREVMDIRQASDYLGISPDSLYRYASEGTLPGFRLGNRWRFKKSRLDSWMDEQSGPSGTNAAGGRSARSTAPPQKKPVRAVR